MTTPRLCGHDPRYTIAGECMACTNSRPEDAMTTPPMVTIWPSYTNQEDAMTTPTPRIFPLHMNIESHEDLIRCSEMHANAIDEGIAVSEDAVVILLRRLSSDLAAAQEARERAEERLRMTAQAERIQIERAQRAEAMAESYKADAEMLAFLLDCHEVNADQFYWLRKAEISHVKAAICDFMGVERDRAARGKE